MAQQDVVIAGAGIVGLSCALALQALGMRVTVLESGNTARQSSWAAAGMLAAHDLANPVALKPLAELSLASYPAFLQRLASLSGIEVPFETEWAFERAPGHRAVPPPDLPQLQSTGFLCIAEQSLDPRKLVAALSPSVHAAGVQVLEHTRMLRCTDDRHGVTIETSNASGHTLRAARFLDCTGAWSTHHARPAKGQMLRVAAPGALTSPTLGNVVVRTPGVYMVPRLDGTVVIGATIEDVGFDITAHDSDLQSLRTSAANLIPALAIASEVERWAGLRPDTPDHLPLIGQTSPHCFVAAGHFRNGILLAPATAHVVAQLLCGQQTTVDLSSFVPGRFD